MDLDHYHLGPFTNEMGRMFGSSRFMAPEEFQRGARIDQSRTQDDGQRRSNITPLTLPWAVFVRHLQGCGQRRYWCNSYSHGSDHGTRLYSPAGARYDPAQGNALGRRVHEEGRPLPLSLYSPAGARYDPAQGNALGPQVHKEGGCCFLCCSVALKGRDSHPEEQLCHSPLSKILVHVIFSTKNRTPCLPSPVRPLLWRYLAGALDALDSRAIQIGGTFDHVHILCHMSKTVTICKLIEQIKIESSKWLKTQDGDLKAFGWQAGHGAFSIGQSAVAATESYILRQEEHHRRVSFEEEYRRFLAKYQIPFDERYIWA